MGSTVSNDTDFSLSILSLSLSQSTTANIPASEWNALYDLYNATSGENWRWRLNPVAGISWNFSDFSINNPCTDQWQGIACKFTTPFM